MNKDQFSLLSGNAQRIRSARYRVQWTLDGVTKQQVVEASKPMESSISAARYILSEIPCVYDKISR